MDRFDGNGRNRRDRKHRDIKQRTMNRYTALDEDVGSQYDFDDDEPILQRPLNDRAAVAVRTLERRIQQQRRDNHLLRIQGGNNRKDFIYQITVKNAAKAGKEVVLQLLANAVDRFYPISPKINRDNIEFYLSNYDDSEAVRSMSRRISDKKNPNQKFLITCQRIPAPWEQLRPNVKIAIEKVVKNRYSRLSNSMDLTDFGNEKAFLNDNLHCPLFNNAVLVHVANIIAQNFKEIHGISLKGNRLRSLDFISTLVYAAPEVVELDLSSNAITRIEELDRIRGWRIERLHLENNECVARYEDASSFARAVHEYFPRVNYLNGISVNRNPFKLEAEEEDISTATSLPYRPGYCPYQNVRQLVEKFLLEYFTFYDGPNGEETRKELIKAYDNNAVLTFAIHRLRDKKPLPMGDDAAYKSYIRSSHNIVYQDKWANYREKIVYRGAMEVAVALSSLPVTQHIKESFILDFNIITNNLFVFTLQGILRDGSDAFIADGDCKFFVRNFVVVQKEDGTMAILSDMLTLTPITVERMQRYTNLLKKASIDEPNLPGPSAMAPPPTPTPQPYISAQLSEPFSNFNVSDEKPIKMEQPLMPNGIQHQLPIQQQQLNNVVAIQQQSQQQQQSTSTAPNYDVNDPEIQKAMVQQFSAISGMKSEWSEKCLMDMNWDFEAAGKIFNEMKATIPNEAFIGK